MRNLGNASEAVRCCDAAGGTEEFRTMAENPMKGSRTLIAELQSEIDRVIGPYLDGVDDFALVDFPNHPNVGDSAIWLGEETYLQKKLGRAPSYVCTYDTWAKEDFERAVPAGPILIHGGGNFGDLWPSHQEFRLRLLSEFPDRQIIQLPQTIHFSSKASLQRAADIINAHKKFLILVRDVQSLTVAREEFTAPVDLCPDMAFCLGPQSSRAAITRNLLLLLRTDHEKVERARSRPLPSFAVVEDWLTERRGLGKWLFLKALLETSLLVFKGRMPSELDARIRWFHLLASNRVARGMKQVGSSAYVITDRLHTHIFCVLLNVPHSVLDNNYGKISTFVDAWSKPFEKLGRPLSTSVDEAVATFLGMCKGAPTSPNQE
ncbi:polysaccharide pyruvyl transferase family protein [Bradyrhizobium sp. 38]|uniref:polysaccharide pyruvyl transferase family protein n=1 Tax=unclassified Bradyrhizobium TaxID=2631580 RepID=UPI001FFB23A4|nr:MULTISPECIES: polysaccharide pyruvyl transferase family protein [unclassified Bradyrhizobium]MCK1334622.1 polysaccharide pyruvyl transferase family protein [Bradyrhizobium sp. 38]MCK1781306.1 polysaccharide pyruvyl transferase family protein [Bradyrhizobium sp. 132]